jgi:D-amino-acid dehydrogenase
MSRVVVVGGGVVGAACALELARRGAEVTVLERDRIGHGCSFGNAGWLTPSLAFPLPAPGMLRRATTWLLDPESPFYIQPRPDPALVSWLIRFLWATRRERFERNTAALVELCRWSVDAWEDLAECGDDTFGFVRSGTLAVHETPEGLAAGRRLAELVAGFGVPFEPWSAEEIREREPAVRGAQVGGHFFPRDARCEPYPATTTLAEAARRAGAVFVEDAEVLGVERTGGTVRAVLSASERYEAEEFVLASGAWSRSLGRRFGLRLPVLGGKGYSLVFPRLDPHPSRSLYLAERKIAVNPHADALRISGTLELVGEDLTINPRRVAAILRRARGLLALPDSPTGVEPWGGLRPCTPDGMPLIGRARGASNLWLATGHQMVGLKAAPATGLLLAELMSGETPSFDPAPFRADRY